MAENDVTIQINLDAKDAQAAIELFGKQSVKVLQKTESQANSFFDVFSGAKGKLLGAIGAISGAFYTMSSAIDQAVEDAKLTRQIEASLRATDEASKSAVDGVLEFADAIKAATGISDDLVKQTFITAKSFGITTEQAKQLTKAAIDLAAATGIDVETAVRQLGGTLDGSIGKIGNLGKEFRNLTSDQLKAGDAIGLVNEKFGGTAAKELDTYQGSINSLKNAWDDFLKILGRTVVNSDVAKNSISSLAEVIDSFNKAITDTRDTTENLDRSIGILYGLGASSSQIEKAVDASLKAQESFNFLGSTIGKQSKEIEQGFAGIVKEAQGSTSAMADFEDRLSSFPQAVIPPLQKTGKELEELQKKAKKLAEEAQKFKEGIFGEFGTQVEREAAKAQQALLKVQEFESKGAFNAKTAYDLRLKIVEDFNTKQLESAKKTTEEEKKAYEEVVDAARRANIDKRTEEQKTQDYLKSVFDNPFVNIGDKLQLELIRGIKILENGVDVGSPFKEGEIAASIAGGINQALQGKQGAVKAIGQVGEAIGASFGIPGLGAITELLARGPEETKKFIKQFIEAIPDIIQAISESIPVVVETLVDVLVNKGGAVRIGIAIAKAMALQPVWGKLGQEIFGKSGNEIGDVIKSGITEGGTRARDGFKEFFLSLGPTFVKAGETFGKNIQDSITQASKSLGPQFRNAFDQFITSLKEFASSIGPALEKFITDVPQAIYDGLSRLFQELGSILAGPLQAVLNPFINLFTEFKDYIGQLNNSINNLIEPINKLIGALGGGISNAGSGISSFFGQIGSALGFAKGGLVYAAGGFTARGTDTVPAMLTPGEMVIPRDMVGELAAYLQRQSPDSAGSDTATLAAILSAVQAPIVVKTEAKVNQNAFADIILQLNRQNARLRA